MVSSLWISENRIISTDEQGHSDLMILFTVLYTQHQVGSTTAGSLVNAGAVRIATTVVETAPVFNKLEIFLFMIQPPLVLLPVALGNGEP